MASERQKTSTTSKAALRTSRVEKEKHRLTQISSLSFEKRGKKARLIHLPPLPTGRVEETRTRRGRTSFINGRGKKTPGCKGAPETPAPPP